MEDGRKKAVEALTAKILRGKRLTEVEVADTLYIARDQVLLSIAQNLLGENFEDMTSVELINLDQTGSGTKTYKRKDILRLYNVLQNAVERHELKHTSVDESPLDALAVAWQEAIKRSAAPNE